jgi:hypothetical protein
LRIIEVTFLGFFYFMVNEYYFIDILFIRLIMRSIIQILHELRRLKLKVAVQGKTREVAKHC